MIKPVVVVGTELRPGAQPRENQGGWREVEGFSVAAGFSLRLMFKVCLVGCVSTHQTTISSGVRLK